MTSKQPFEAIVAMHGATVLRVCRAILDPVRAVGTVFATNLLPIVVPCHHVVRTDGSLGGYLGGRAAKRLLLKLEAAA